MSRLIPTALARKVRQRANDHCEYAHPIHYPQGAVSRLTGDHHATGESATGAKPDQSFMMWPNLRTRAQAFLTSRWFYALAITAVVCKLLVLFGNAWLASQPRTINQVEFVAIQAGRPKLLPFGLRQGEILELSVTVRSGAPVDVLVGRLGSVDEKKTVIKGSGLPSGKQRMTFELREKWLHATPAIIVVTTMDRSELTLQVKRE